MTILKAIGGFIQEQLLGMKWLQKGIGQVLSSLGMDLSTPIGGSLHFFLYDVIKITALLCFLIFIISYIQSYFPPERSKKILGRFHGIEAVLGSDNPFGEHSKYSQSLAKIERSILDKE